MSALKCALSHHSLNSVETRYLDRLLIGRLCLDTFMEARYWFLETYRPKKEVEILLLATSTHGNCGATPKIRFKVRMDQVPRSCLSVTVDRQLMPSNKPMSTLDI